LIVLSRLLAGAAILLLAAHVLRTGQVFLVLLILALLPLMAVRRPWAGYVITGVLWLGTAEWVRTLVSRSQERVATGQPFGRLVLILGSVALFTALAALSTQRGPLSRWFRSARP
jgi:hypothetical protein